MAIYERHQPESTVHYQSVAIAWPKVEVEYAINEQAIAPYVTAEFERYKRCGILENGFVRLYCKDYQAERVIGFSCKGRGLCPSCGSRRALQKTPEHPIYGIHTNSWIRAGELKAGAVLQRIDSSHNSGADGVEVVAVDRAKSTGETKVYNITTGNQHNYFAA